MVLPGKNTEKKFKSNNAGRNIMKNLFILISILIFAISCNDKQEVQTYSIEQFMNNTTIFGNNFSNDNNRILFTSNESGVYNLYSFSIDSKESTQLSFSEDSILYSISYFPKDDRILYRTDNGGNEHWQICILHLDGTNQSLTSADNRSLFLDWKNDGTGFFYTSNKRDSKNMDVYFMEIGNFTSKMIFQNDNTFTISAISKDGKYIGLQKIYTRDFSEMFLYNCSSYELTKLSNYENDINNRIVCFSPDSEKLYYLTDENSEFQYLKCQVIITAEETLIKKTNWDISDASFSDSGNFLIISINNDGKTELELRDAHSNEIINLKNIPQGEISSVSISDNDQYLSFYNNASNYPDNLFLFNLSTKNLSQLSQSINPEINPNDLVEAKLVRYKSFDGLEIPAWLFLPKNIDKNEKVPAMIWVHGGPGSQTRISYFPLLQYLTNHGYAILAVNNRGSSGYGKSFYKADDCKHGDADLKDCIAGKDILIQTGVVDPEKIGIMGWSYGGCMTLAGLAFTPDEFKVGVDMFGVSNWLRTLENIPAWWGSYRDALFEELGDPEKDRDHLIKISPLFHARNINKPLLVLQGANDQRVLKEESQEIVDAVKANGVIAELVLFENEGHGFRKRSTEIEAYSKILEFLDEYLKKDKIE